MRDLRLPRPHLTQFLGPSFRERLIIRLAQILPLLSITILIFVVGDPGVARLLVLVSHQVPALGEGP